MTRVFLTLGIASVTLFAAAIGVIHLPPYSDADVSLLLHSEDDCVAPCFLGIHPGETSAAAAVALLDNHPWVGEVYPLMSDVDWLWSGRQPAVFDTGSSFFQGRIEVHKAAVDTIVVRTHLRNGDWRLALGEPDRIILLSPDEPSWRAFIYIAVYDRYQLYLLNFLDCAATPEIFWNAPTDVAFREPRLSFVERLELTRMPDWLFRIRSRGCI